MRLELHRDAGVELDAAAAWYEDHRAGLGEELVEEVDRAFDVILAAPRTWPLVRRAKQHEALPSDAPSLRNHLRGLTGLWFAYSQSRTRSVAQATGATEVSNDTKLGRLMTARSGVPPSDPLRRGLRQLDAKEKFVATRTKVLKTRSVRAPERDRCAAGWAEPAAVTDPDAW